MAFFVGFQPTDCRCLDSGYPSTKKKRSVKTGPKPNVSWGYRPCRWLQPTSVQPPVTVDMSCFLHRPRPGWMLETRVFWCLLLDHAQLIADLLSVTIVVVAIVLWYRRWRSRITRTINVIAYPHLGSTIIPGKKENRQNKDLWCFFLWQPGEPRHRP